MPKYYEDKEEDGRACGGVREDLRQCLLESSCVLQVSAAALPGESPVALGPASQLLLLVLHSPPPG
ncbi:PREDICTED: cytochrome c oxidase assembly factor 5-like [Nipponia nippon]|uniref:cytochrome c oxidase assembly factor 5-like n=1 Tax=Nipponia nippon TaxID=128390 RepID=UPI000510B8B7|nr:PREDICTED: cytochrome c oxidase assembly factor 5-like [Nipponia nippon]